MQDLLTCIQAVEYIKNKFGRDYTPAYFRLKCIRGEFEAIKPARDWLIHKSSLDSFKPGKPGLKAGQKINRKAKGSC